MKVAIAVTEDRVCQRLDCANKLVVIELYNGREQGRQTLDLSDWPVRGRALRLAQHGIDTLICGGVSSFDEAGFDDSGIRLIACVTGPVQHVLSAILSGTVTPGREYWHAGGNGHLRGLSRPDAGYCEGSRTG